MLRRQQAAILGALIGAVTLGVTLLIVFKPKAYTPEEEAAGYRHAEQMIEDGRRAQAEKLAASAAHAAAAPAPTPVVPADSPRQRYVHPDEGEIGEIDCHHDMATAPLLATTSKFDAWTADGSKADALMFTFGGKLLDTGDHAKVIRYTGQKWIHVLVTSGNFTGVEGYTFVTCVNK